MTNPTGLLAAVGLLLTLVIGGVFLDRSEPQPAADPASVNFSIPPVAVLPTVEEPVVLSPTPVPVQPSVAKTSPIRTIASWRTFDAPAHPDNTQPVDILEMVFHTDGKHLLCRQRESVTLRDIATGRVFQKYAIPAHRAILSPDAEIIAEIGEVSESITLHRASNRVVVRKWRPPTAVYNSFQRPIFTASGKVLIAFDSFAQPIQGFSIPLAAEDATIFPRSPNPGPNSRYMTIPAVVAVPKADDLLIQELSDRRTAPHATVVSRFNPWTGSLKPLRSVKGIPGTDAIDIGMTVSGDGRWLLCRSMGLEMIDWRNDTRRYQVADEGSTFLITAFLPDSSHFLTIRTWPKRMWFSGPKAGQDATVPTALEIYQTASGKRIESREVRELSMNNRITALAVSPDGNRVAIANGPVVKVIDLEWVGLKK